MVSRGLKKFGRGFVKGLRRSGSLLQKGARAGRSILGKIDKMSGGAGTNFLMSTPEGMGVLGAGHALAGAPDIR
jgi:hypothetical protein